jgi:hypothetical protein
VRDFDWLLDLQYLIRGELYYVNIPQRRSLYDEEKKRSVSKVGQTFVEMVVASSKKRWRDLLNNKAVSGLFLPGANAIEGSSELPFLIFLVQKQRNHH